MQNIVTQNEFLMVIVRYSGSNREWNTAIKILDIARKYRITGRNKYTKKRCGKLYRTGVYTVMTDEGNNEQGYKVIGEMDNIRETQLKPVMENETQETKRKINKIISESNWTRVHLTSKHWLAAQNTGGQENKLRESTKKITIIAKENTI